MKIINKQSFITNSQLQEIINLLGQEYRPSRIIVFERPIESIIYKIKNCFHITEYDLKGMPELQGGQTVQYMILTDTIKIFLDYKKDIMDKEEKQVNLIFDLVVELRRMYCLGEKMKEMGQKKVEVSDIINTYGMLMNEPDGSLIYKFASDFMNQNADGLSILMNWKEKWTFDEEK